MEKFHSYIPIPVECHTSINHLAFDGCYYFCTIRCKNEIIRFRPNCDAWKKYCTCREYDCICYDFHEHCFWASTKTCYHKIFKLDCCMNEIDCIHVCVPVQYGVITGISYHCCKDRLLVSYTCAVVEIEKCHENAEVLYAAKGDLIMGVLSICPGMLLTVLSKNQYYIRAIDQHGKTTGCYCVDHPCILRNLIFNPCAADKCHKSEIWAFLLKKNRYPYLYQSSISVDELGFLPCRCNYEICEECCCKEQNCGDCTPCEDIMESIALVEAALSHILNAEGEKVQKVLSVTDDIDQIMCVNREVNKTIMNVTQLEQTLYAKLSALSDCGCCGEFCQGKAIGKCCCEAKNIGNRKR